MEISDEQVAVKEGFESEVFELPGVTGLGIGLRQEGEEVFEEDVAIRVYVEDENEIPEGIPEEVDGIPVSVIQFAPEPYAEDTERYAELKGGCRIQAPRFGGGTMGAIVQGRDIEGNPVPYGLTAGHVVGMPAEFPFCPFQPENPPVATGTTSVSHADALGRVVKSIYPANEGERKTIDAAIFELEFAELQGRTFSPAILGAKPNEDLTGGVTEIWQPEDRRPEAGQPVRKRGFVTLVTDGFVVDVHYKTKEWEPAGTGLDAQFLVMGSGSGSSLSLTFAASGDSGSLVLEAGTSTALGLLVGGERGGSGRIGICTPIMRIESAFKVRTIWA